MNGKQMLKRAVCFVVVVLTAAVGMAQQQSAPTENKGVDIKLLQTFDLGPQIESMAGRQFRMRKIIVEPGGVLGIHNHKDRPGLVYILKGTITEHRGDAVKNYSVGETWTETKEVTHWAENKGTAPAEVLAVDIFQP